MMSVSQDIITPFLSASSSLSPLEGEFGSKVVFAVDIDLCLLAVLVNLNKLRHAVGAGDSAVRSNELRGALFDLDHRSLQRITVLVLNDLETLLFLLFLIAVILVLGQHLETI